jgi:RNA ligase
MSNDNFEGFGKIARLNRDCIITEKLDGTNAQVFISEQGEVRAGSRNRWIFPEDDNYGFARWVESNKDELLKLGPGRHFGEWWGSGIQCGYGLTEKRFSLFNVNRWGGWRPSCCHVVPTLYSGPFSMEKVDDALWALRNGGSHAAPGFMRPEGVIVYHTAARTLFKATLEKDEQPKGVAA